MENLSFAHVHSGNANQFKKLYKLYPPYKIKALRHHGESPYGKKAFRTVLDSIIEHASSGLCDDGNKHFVLMHLGDDIIGFAVFNTCVNEPVELPYSYGYVGDYYIVPKFRRRGFGRKLNEYMEHIFVVNGTGFILLHPDPVTGAMFWEAMGYTDTGLNKGYGLYSVYVKHLRRSEDTEKIDFSIKSKITRTDYMNVNPYNKKQIRELNDHWLSYWRETISHSGKKAESSRKIKRRLKNRVMHARKTPKNHFCALYYESNIIGFSWFSVFSDSKVLNVKNSYGYVLEFYIAPEFRRRGFGAEMNENMEKMLSHDGATEIYLTPDSVTGAPFWMTLGYCDSGKTDADRPIYMKSLPESSR